MSPRRVGEGDLAPRHGNRARLGVKKGTGKREQGTGDEHRREPGKRPIPRLREILEDVMRDLPPRQSSS